MQHLLQGGAYSGKNVQGEAFIRKRHLFETRQLLEQMR